MLTLVTDLIAEAKSLVHDDHDAVQGWIGDDNWLRWLNAEYRQLYTRLLRDGVMEPAVVSETMDLPSHDIDDAEVIVMVTEAVGTSKRVLRQAQASLGRAHQALASDTGTAMNWTAAPGATGGITVTLQPAPSSGTYVVSYIVEPPVLVTEEIEAGETDVLHIPAVAANRLALGAARRALIRGGGRSSSIDQLIRETDEELSFAASGRLAQDGLRVRNVDWRTRGWMPRGQDSGLSLSVWDRSGWYWR
jgi:hypothetical protein